MEIDCEFEKIAEIEPLKKEVGITYLQRREKRYTGELGSFRGICAGETVEFVGFGKFGVKDVAERNGHNPRTGEDIVIAAHKAPYFRAGKVLKDAVNGNG